MKDKRVKEGFVEAYLLATLKEFRAKTGMDYQDVQAINDFLRDARNLDKDERLSPEEKAIAIQHHRHLLEQQIGLWQHAHAPKRMYKGPRRKGTDEPLLPILYSSELF